MSVADICSRFLSMQLVYLHRHPFLFTRCAFINTRCLSKMHAVYSPALIILCSDTERLEFLLTHKYTESVCINFMKCTKARAIDMQTRGSVCLVTKRDEQPQNLPQCYPVSALFALLFSQCVAKSPCASPDKLVWFD